MDLADGVGAFGLVIHCIGFASWDHDLISKTAVVILAMVVFL